MHLQKRKEWKSAVLSSVHNILLTLLMHYSVEKTKYKVI